MRELVCGPVHGQWMHEAQRLTRLTGGRPLLRSLLGLDLGEWRCARTGRRIAEWVLDPYNVKFVCGRAAVGRWMGRFDNRPQNPLTGHTHDVTVSTGCRTTLIRHAAPALCAQGRTIGQAAIELGCSDGTVKRALRLAGHPRNPR